MSASPNAIALAVARQVVAQARCNVCGRHYHWNAVTVLGRHGTVWAMRVHCRDCRRDDLLFAVLEHGEPHPRYTDLAAEEWERFKDRPPISVDDVIVFHTHIQTYRGDFSEILDEPLPPE